MPTPSSSIICARRPQHIMKCNTRIQYDLYSLWLCGRAVSRQSQQLASMPKGILKASSGLRKAIIEDPLVLFHRCCSERLHYHVHTLRANALPPIMKYRMGRSSPGRGSCCGISMELIITVSRNVNSFHSWASDAAPGAPTWTHVNL